MILYYINGSDRSGDVIADTLRITNQIGQRTDNCSFSVFQGTKPSENQDLKIYAAAYVSSISGSVITLKNSYQTGVNRFFVGQTVHLKIGDATEVTALVTAYNETTRELTVDYTFSSANAILQEDSGGLLTEAGDTLVQEDSVASSTITLVENDLVGVLIFGGVISGVDDYNVENINILEWRITGVDYTKIFDKKLISDSWQSVDSRYIINDFVHRTVNYNQTIDELDYADNIAIQAEYIESGDGANPTIDSADFMEGNSSGVFSWTFSGGQAIWSATPTSMDLSQFTGISSGMPTAGELSLWAKTSDFADITTLKIRIGSSSSDYIECTLDLQDTTDWGFAMAKLVNGTMTGTPDWTAADYAAIVVNETASGVIRINGIRLSQNGSFTMFGITPTPDFDDLRSPQLKPTALMNLLAKTWEYTWYVDYEKDIHFAAKEATLSPYNLSDTSNNFDALEVDVDASNIGNRVLIKGGEKTSASRYSQVFQGDGVLREWILKNKFNDLEVSIDNNGTTHAAEAGTTTTNIKITAHGLSTGDHVVNRTRTAVRQITVVDANNFTVEAVTSQTNGDTISFFASAQTLGVEGLADETTVDYVSNSNEKSVRATSIEATLTSTSYIRFEYNERIPIQVQYTDTTSANALKALGFGDGIFDLDPITDRNIKDTNTALTIAQAKVAQFANATILGRFKTDQEGLSAGQLLHVQETNRALDADYVIQKMTLRVRGGEFKDYFEISVEFGTTLFGWIEFMQKLLSAKDGIEINTDDIVETFVTSNEDVTTDDTGTTAIGGFKKATLAEDVTTDDVNATYETTVPWQWEASSGQAVATRWDLFEWG